MLSIANEKHESKQELLKLMWVVLLATEVFLTYIYYVICPGIALEQLGSLIFILLDILWIIEKTQLLS